MIIHQSINCPYCGEAFAIDIDTSSGSQEYIEDCHICCQPITFRIHVDYDGNLTMIDARRDDD